MTVLIPEGFAQVAFRWKTVGDLEAMISTIGVAIPEAADPALLANAMVAIATFPGSICQASLMSTQYSFVGTEVFARVGGDIVTSESTATTVGTVSAMAPPPNNCAVLVKKLTNFGGRRNRGRMFLPPCGVNEGEVDSAGIILPARLAILQGQVNVLREQLEAADYGPYLFHSSGPTATATLISALSVQGQIATQRKRMR
jgi:hypothetical protein